LRSLLRRAVRRPAAGGGAGLLPGPPGAHPDRAPGGGRLVVGLPAVQLPPAVGHGDGADVAEVLPQGALTRPAAVAGPPNARATTHGRELFGSPERGRRDRPPAAPRTTADPRRG